MAVQLGLEIGGSTETCTPLIGLRDRDIAIYELDLLGFIPKLFRWPS